MEFSLTEFASITRGRVWYYHRGPGHMASLIPSYLNTCRCGIFLINLDTCGPKKKKRPLNENKKDTTC